MIVGKKALIGILGLGTAAAALGWMLLPKNSGIKKSIAKKASSLGNIFKNHIDDVVRLAMDKKASPVTAKKS